MKTILSLRNSSSKGKSGTLRDLARLLLLTYPTYKAIKPDPACMPDKGDFILVMDIDGVIVGIASQGDPGTGLRKKLEDLIHTYGCDIIVCATRTRGDTVKTVSKIALQNKYDTIRTATYEVGNGQCDMANQLKAGHLLELLQHFRLLPLPKD